MAQNRRANWPILSKIRLQGPGARAGPQAQPASGDLFAQPDASTVAVQAQRRDVAYDTILTWAQLDAWLARIQAAPLVAIDTETTSLDELRAAIVGISFSVEPGPPPTSRWQYEGRTPAQLPLAEVLARLKPWLEDLARPSWASTSSTTAMCLPTTASRYAATPTTPCCKAMC